jgi:TM2 domain-containing membrane protein YozV
MSRPKVILKDPALAAFLAFLIPGLGHFYQRRVFKGVLYCVCILGTFFTGLRIGHGQVVYFHWKQPENRTYAYLCQFWVGLPALPALAQAKLRSKDAFDPNFVPRPFSSHFEGTLSESGFADGKMPEKSIGTVTGTIELKPRQVNPPKYWRGTLHGTLTTADGSHKIEGEVEQRGGWLESEVAPWPERQIKGFFAARLENQPENQPAETYKLEGFIPRPLWNYFEAPLQDPRSNDLAGEPSDLDRAHRELGGRFELGVVYTMIAGLLNILAIYDAYEGPAYEDEEDDEAPSDKPPGQPEPPQTT